MVGVGVGYLLRDALSPSPVRGVRYPVRAETSAVTAAGIPAPAPQPGYPAETYSSKYTRAADARQASGEAFGDDEQDEPDGVAPDVQVKGAAIDEKKEQPAYAAPEIKIPAAQEPQPAPAGTEAELFVKNTALYRGRELTFELQMLVVRRAGDRWRLNFSFPDLGKRLYYLYLDDSSNVLGEKPDLRIGYFYTVTFFCANGDLTSGNRLISVKHLGRKADWATGVTAIEYP